MLTPVGRHGPSTTGEERVRAEPFGVVHYLVHTPVNTALEAMVRAAGSRWPVEECFESGKGEVGLGEYEVRSYTG